MDFQFKDFPLSYRVAQFSVTFTLISLVIVGRIISKPILPDPIRFLIIAVLLTAISVSLLASSYVVVRYPFLSLVEPGDGDFFSQHFPSRRKLIFRILGLGFVCMFAVMVVTLISSGKGGPGKVWIMLYCISMIPALLFLIFIYKPIAYPTVATYLRATLGIGIPLIPIMFPLILIGSVRCRRLLHQAELKLKQ
jgi:hypothetical protein